MMTVSIACSIVGLLSSAGIGEKHSLLLNSKVGDSFSYEMRSVGKIGPQEVVFTSKYNMTIISLEPKGVATFKTVQSSGVYTVAGKESKVPESVVTAKLRLNGVVVSFDPPSPTAEAARLNRLMQYVVADHEVEKGAKWSWKDPASATNGNVPAEGNGEVVEFAEHQGIPCAHLRIGLKETSGEHPGTSSFDVWIALKDGMIVENAASLDNVPFGPGVVGKMTMTVNRVKK